MLGKLTVPADLSKRLPEQGLELLSVTAGRYMPRLWDRAPSLVR